VLLQGFLHRIYRRVGCYFQQASAIFQPASVVPRAHIRHHMRSVRPRRCSRASSPRAWARLRRSGRALRLVSNAPSPSLRGTEGEVSATPIERVANCGFLVELLTGDSSGRPCPVR
jgi:hypothetical protein